MKLLLIFACSLGAFAQGGGIKLTGKVILGTNAAPPAGPTLIQQTAGGGSTCIATSGTVIACTLPGSTTAGHELFVTFGSNPVGAPIIGITAGACSVSWVRLVIVSTNRNAEIWECTNAAGGTTTINLTTLGTCSGSGCIGNISEWTGVAGTADGTNTGNNAGSTAMTAGSITTTNAVDVVFSLGRDASAGAPGGPSNSFIALNSPATTESFQPAYLITSTTGTYSTTWTLSGSAAWAAAIVAIY